MKSVLPHATKSHRMGRGRSDCCPKTPRSPPRENVNMIISLHGDLELEFLFPASIPRNVGLPQQTFPPSNQASHRRVVFDRCLLDTLRGFAELDLGLLINPRGLSVEAPSRSLEAIPAGSEAPIGSAPCNRLLLRGVLGRSSLGNDG
jgi:hypothetical protein